MKLEFTDERIREFVDGPLHFKNTGTAIDVSASTAADLLKRRHFLDGDWVSIFAPADKAATKKVAKDALATYPKDFPSADALAKAGLDYEAARLLTKEQLIDLNGIGPKTADAILEARGEK